MQRYNANTAPFETYPDDGVWINDFIRTLTTDDINKINIFNQILRFLSGMDRLTIQEFHNEFDDRINNERFIRQMTNINGVVKNMSEMSPERINALSPPLQVRYRMLNNILTWNNVIKYLRLLFTMMHMNTNFLNVFDGGSGSAGSGIKKKRKSKKQIRGGTVHQQSDDPALVNSNAVDGGFRVYTIYTVPIQLIDQDFIWLQHAVRIIPEDAVGVIDATTQLLKFLVSIQGFSDERMHNDIQRGLKFQPWITRIRAVYDDLRFYFGPISRALINSIEAMAIRGVLIDDLLRNREINEKLTMFFNALNLPAFR